MEKISLEMAQTLSEMYKLTASDVETAAAFDTNNFTATECCAKLLADYAREIRKAPHPTKMNYGAQITDFKVGQEPAFQVSKENESFVFEEIPLVILRCLGCSDNNCHQNCINACRNGLPSSSILHTSIIVSPENCGPSQILHSYVQLGEEIFDLDLGIKMQKASYDKLFSVTELSCLPASTVQADLADGTIAQLSKSVSTESYLMARDDCSKLVKGGK